jgi:hypothetical protein
MKGTILFLIPGIVFGIVCSFFNKDFENLDVLEVKKKEEVKICFDSSFFYRQTYSTERDNRSSGR